MIDRFDQGSLEFEVSNFGPIVEARIDLRPLTVFIGPSNTGKSYLAILIYALHKYFSPGNRPRGRHFFRRRQMFRGSGPNGRLTSKNMDDFAELLERISAHREDPQYGEGIVLPDSIAEIIRSGFAEQGGFLGDEIVRCLGIRKVGSLIRNGAKREASVLFRRHDPTELSPFDHRLTINAHESEFKTIFPEGTQLRIPADYLFDTEYFFDWVKDLNSGGDITEEQRDYIESRLLETLPGHFLSQLAGPLLHPAFYLPAGRTGAMQAHSVVVGSLIENASMTGERAPILSGVMADFLQQLIKIDRPASFGRPEPRHDSGLRIEKAVLGGSVGVENSEAIGYPHFTYRPDGWRDSLPLMNASSMVSELAPVVLYLRHVVESRNVLIIEEPESHLHPAMQVEFTRQLAALIYAGIRVIVTTHSEWVLEELTNIVRRSKLPLDERKKTASGEFALEPDRVGVWLFQPKGRPRGSVVEEVCLDDSGVFPSGFDDVAAALHNDWADLASRIGEAE